MNWKESIKEALGMLEKSDRGIIFLDMYNKVIHPSDAAFYKQEVYPKDLVKTLEDHFSSMGLPLKDPEVRKDLIELIQKYEEAKLRRPKKII